MRHFFSEFNVKYRRAVMPSSTFIGVVPIITAIVAFEAGAQFCVKRSKSSTGETSTAYFLLAVVLYAMVCGCLSKSYDHSQMGIVNVLWSAASVLAIILVGTYAYHETLTPTDVAGIISIMIGVFLIFIQDHPDNPTTTS